MAAAAPLLTPRRPLPVEALLGRVALFELDLLRGGVRDLVRLTLPRRQLGWIVDWLSGDGLACHRWCFDLVPAREAALDAYSIRGRLAAADSDPAGSPVLFVARDAVRLAGIDMLACDDWWQGVALGYPPCCIARYSDNPAAFLDGYDRIFGEYAGPFPCWANVLAEPLGHMLISHFPCSPTCGPSRAAAEASLRLLLDSAPARALATLSGLRRLMLYDRELGVLGLGGASEGGCLSLDGAEASGRWRSLLAPEAGLRVEDRGDCAIAGWAGGPAGGTRVRRLDFRGGFGC